MDLGTKHLRLERRGPIGWLVVDNPERRNALSMAMYAGLSRAIRAVGEDPELAALVVTGVDDVFIVGGDVSDHGDLSSAERKEPFEALLLEGTVPVVAAVNGHCQASGVLFAVLADVSVVSDQARFRLPELRRGVAAPWSSTVLPAVVGVARAKELALTSRPFDAHEAQAMGLVARVVAHDDLEAEAERTAYELLEAGPEARRTWKRALHANLPSLDEGAVEASYRTAEAAEGFTAFVERRPPAWSPRHRRSAPGPDAAAGGR